jgi:hypothetical protein
MSLKPPTFANYPQFTEVFDTTSPILRPWTAVFQTADLDETIAVPAQGPNFYLTKVVSPGLVEISFDSPGPNWSPCSPGIGFQGQNFRRVYLRRRGNAVAFDSVEFFTGSAQMTNFTSVYRPPGRRMVTSISRINNGLMLPANEKRAKVRLTAHFPVPDANGYVTVGFGADQPTAEFNALRIPVEIENLPSRGYLETGDETQYGYRQMEFLGFTGSDGNTYGSVGRIQLQCEIETTDDIFIACYDTANLTFNHTTFSPVAPCYVIIEETIYD